MDASSVSDDFSDYDVISNSGMDSSLADLSLAMSEPPPTKEARDLYNTATLSPEDIQKWTRESQAKSKQRSSSAEQRTVRVYVDGVFDIFGVGHALQLRQAKLAFPSVHLIVGVFSDELCSSYGSPAIFPHVERCEVVRHCRWVDEVIGDVPWRVDEQLLSRRRIDYVAIDEGTTVDPKCDTVRVKGYDDIKKLGKVILTKRTHGLTAHPVSKLLTTPGPPPHIPVQPANLLSLPTPTAEEPEERDHEPLSQPIVDLYAIGI
ncbi:Nucleotidylyl transferase [Guyanagaster necrorhizus]|uniref:choline-phosphate cytidylyltransferase n=1 Tax=Guyanagaster necrorhizus TaxID=856835 RepID=A0A9P7VNA2_9AGAR|nr:Nucleotidylyl transferase [Guyanagaster necrorhizus MCA 3950]KAG7444328.1 Nucleotidylyl transferase [Guyanagaster necrorhizus MCA 3950]